MNTPDLNNLSDAELLDRFDEQRDERSFAEIVRRHGSMVLATAQRHVECRQDAEEAFQATFFALAASYGRLRHKTVIVAWLFSTAQKCARSIHRANVRRKRRLQAVASRGQLVTEMDTDRLANPSARIADEEIAQVLDEEIARLPASISIAIVLCDLEGLSHSKAAKQLGIASSTLTDRICKGRKLLKNRLLNRGVTVPLVTIMVYLKSTAPDALCASLIADTTSKATLFASGKTAAEIGVSSTLFQSAKRVTSTMTRSQLTAIVLGAIFVVLFIGSRPGVLGTSPGVAFGATIFIDDFKDGNVVNELPVASNGTPVKWTEAGNTPGHFDASSGDYVMSAIPESNPDINIGADALDFVLKDTSVRVHGKISASEGLIGIAVRNQDARDAQQYFGGIGYLSGDSTLFLGRVDGRGALTVLGNTTLPFDIRQQDGVLQLDVIDDELSVWAWKAGEKMPDEPQLTAFDSTYESGFVRIIGGVDHNRVNTTTFRSVHVATAHIPEPDSASLLFLGFASLAMWAQLSRA